MPEYEVTYAHTEYRVAWVNAETPEAAATLVKGYDFKNDDFLGNEGPVKIIEVDCLDDVTAEKEES